MSYIIRDSCSYCGVVASRGTDKEEKDAIK